MVRKYIATNIITNIPRGKREESVLGVLFAFVKKLSIFNIPPIKIIFSTLLLYIILALFSIVFSVFFKNI